MISVSSSVSLPGLRRMASGVAIGLRILQVKRVSQRFQGNVVGALQISHGLPQLLGAGAHQSFKIGLISAVFQLETSVFHRPPYRGQKLLALKWFQQVVISAVANSG